MNLKYILIVWGAMLFCVGCSEDDVDSSYSFDVAGLKATVTNDKGSVVEMNTILLDSLQQQGFVGEVSFSEETRAENDRLAEEKFAEKLENIKNKIPKAGNISEYIWKNAGYPVYQNTDIVYYDEAVKGLEAQLSAL